MKNPIKIIYKYKNNNRRNQYKIFIFIGSLVNEKIMNILNIIKNKDFFNTLKIISLKQYKEISNYYGEKWYEYFFTSYHINNEKNTIIKNNNKKKIIVDKYGKEWYKIHIENKIVKN